MHEFSQFTYVNTESDGFLYMPLFRCGATCKLIYRNKKLSYTKIVSDKGYAVSFEKIKPSGTRLKSRNVKLKGQRLYEGSRWIFLIF